MTVKYHRKLNSLKTEVIEALILIGRYVKCYTPWAYQQIKLNVALNENFIPKGFINMISHSLS